MVRLQKQKAYVYRTESGEKIEHYKHLVNIPDETVHELGWAQGVELRPKVNGSSLTLEPLGDQTPNKSVKSTTATDITPKRKVRR